MHVIKSYLAGGLRVTRKLRICEVSQFELPVAYCLLPIANYLLPIAYCLLPIAYCQFLTTSCSSCSHLTLFLTSVSSVNLTILENRL